MIPNLDQNETAYGGELRELDLRGRFLYRSLLDEAAINQWTGKCMAAFDSEDSGMTGRKNSRNSGEVDASRVWHA